MSPIRDFVSNLARAGQNATEILELLEKAFGPKVMSRQQVNVIIRLVKSGQDTVDLRGTNPHRTVRTHDAKQKIREIVEEDRQSTIEEIALQTGLSETSVHRVLTEDLGLTKKSARWVPHLLTADQKKKRLEASEEFLFGVPRETQKSSWPPWLQWMSQL